MSVFSYNHYKDYLSSVLKKRGLRSQLASQLRCNPSFISRILNGETHFSLEQGDRINHFLSHQSLESKYFMALLNQARAGSTSLEAFFQSEISELRKKNQDLHYRFSNHKKQIDAEVKSQYYSNWLYAAVDSMLTSGLFKNDQQLAERLKVDIKQVRIVKESLLTWGIIRKEENSYVGASHIHLASDSPEILKHHVNWRLQILRTLATHEEQDLHYSSLVTLSYADVEKVRSLCLDAIQKIVATVKPSPAEDGYVFCLDFSRL